jgi:[ribosomal protein S18]-alanine N-acetyltransferase
MMDSPEGAHVILRPMTLADLSQVEEIEQVSFPTPWPEQAFHYELTHNRNALCWIAEWRPVGQEPVIAATLVIWLILDEAHIGTLAVRLGYRRQGIAQRLLAKGLIESARSGATHALLEVRESNQPAQGLYQKFGFDVVGTRPGYYQDTREDALLMTLAPLDPDRLAQLAEPR